MASANAITAGKAYVTIAAIDRTKHTLDKIAQNVRAKAQEIQSIGSQMVFSGAAAATAAAIPVAQYARFEDAMLAVSAKMQTNQSDYEKLTKLAQHYGETTSYTAQQVAETMIVMAQMGLKAGDVEQSLGAILNAARATGTELPAMADYILTAVRSFGGDFSDAAQYADVLTAACNNSALSMDDLGQALQFAAASGSLAGSDIKEITTVLGTLANMGIRGTMAGTGLRRIYEKLATEREKLEALGVHPFDENGNYKPIMDTIKEITKAVENMPAGEKIQLLTSIFEVRGMTAAAKLTQSNLDDLTAAIYNSGGVAVETAKKMDSGVGGSFRLIWSAVEGAGNALGAQFRDAIVNARDSVIGLVQTNTEWIRNHRTAVLMTAAGIGATLALGAAFITTGIAIRTASFAMSGFGIAMGVLGSILRLGTGIIGLIPLAIGMIGTLATAITSVSALSMASAAGIGILASVMIAFWPSIIAGTMAVFTAIGQAAAETFPGMTELCRSMGKAVLQIFGSAGQAIVGFFEGIWQTISHAGSTAWKYLSSAGSALFNNLRSDCTATFNAITAQISNGDWSGAFQTAVLGLRTIWADFTAFFVEAWHGAALAFSEIWLQCQTTFQKISNKIADGIAAVYGLFLDEDSKKTFYAALSDEQQRAHRELLKSYQEAKAKHLDAMKAARDEANAQRAALHERAATIQAEATKKKEEQAAAEKAPQAPEIPPLNAVQAIPTVTTLLDAAPIVTKILEVANAGSNAAYVHFQENQNELRRALLEQQKNTQNEKNVANIANNTKGILNILEKQEEPEAIF